MRRHAYEYIAALCALVLTTTSLSASDCTQTSVGLVPIDDLGASLYLGQFQGGLYPGGSNLIPAGHIAEAMARIPLIMPRNNAGEPDPNGMFALLSIGMFNTSLEFGTFVPLARAHPSVNNVQMAVLDGATGGQSSDDWDSPDEANYDRVRDNVLAAKGLTEAQVQVCWVKTANPGPNVSLPAAGADAFVMLEQLGNIIRSLQARYPNLQLVFVSSRIYAGYATTGLNPEPYAYETGFTNKWIIGAQIHQAETGVVDSLAGDLDLDAGAPWIGWGPYLWADGLTPRNDGLTWLCTDLRDDDGTHPSDDGKAKVANLLLQFFLTSPVTQDWFRTGPIGDVNLDGIVNVHDLLDVLAVWGVCEACAADFNGDDVVNVSDLLNLLMNWG